MPKQKAAKIALPTEKQLNLQPIKQVAQSETESETLDDFSDINESIKFFAPKPPIYEDHKIKQAKLKYRLIATGAMSLATLLIVGMGHLYCVILVIGLAFISYKEIMSLKRKDEKDQMSIFSWIDWYYFATFTLGVFPQILIKNKQMKESIEKDSILSLILIQYHKMIAFFCFIFGLLMFVMSLKRGSLRYSFTRLSWTLFSLFIVFTLPASAFYNIYKGMFWFFIPHAIVVVNDSASFLFGYFFGKTPLIMLSPKKTWEGFLGGLVTTFALTYFISEYFAGFSYMVCPQTNITFAMIQGIQCDLPQTFMKQNFELPFAFMGYKHILIRPSTIHALTFALFATVFSPFAGYLISGFKRGLRIESIGNTFGDHGGIMDRFERHGMMAVFVYCYISSIIFRSSDAMERTISLISTLSPEGRIKLYQMINSTAFNQINALSASIISRALQ
ncbi:phosphatidate cytidylyltransferase [Stylonychia lemnae]|uniref:phosphatidate cytidylyltransferase n=1 Tax=Stylonychia lemnae TaxID=5949 RepID=A0A078A0A5_STYLE|nr:phosphatidate cytidylyltransferase [Stylonychia lemnae]|eukprot:CDW74213.1 phosphatidate cytidylyltransferase [Stylonychia lemnae]